MPVAQKIGPDGCVYIMDWYDRYHCYQDANRDPPGLDRLKGRIYRISYNDAPLAKPFDLAKASTEELVKQLGQPERLVAADGAAAAERTFRRRDGARASEARALDERRDACVDARALVAHQPAEARPGVSSEGAEQRKPGRPQVGRAAVGEMRQGGSRGDGSA